MCGARLYRWFRIANGKVMAIHRNHIFAMDILSTGVPSTKGYQHVLVMIDLYKKFQQYVPLQTETAV
jgi:hypothetical protein